MNLEFENEFRIKILKNKKNGFGMYLNIFRNPNKKIKKLNLFQIWLSKK